LESALTSLGIGEAVVTVLSERGAPTPVAWTRMRAPRSLMDTIGPEAISAAAKASPLQAEYGQTIDRDSAYERLNARIAEPEPAPVPADTGFAGAETTATVKTAPPQPGVVEEVLKSSAFKSFLRSAATVAGREITRSILGTGRRKR
jgi:hypothetical protein